MNRKTTPMTFTQDLHEIAVIVQDVGYSKNQKVQGKADYDKQNSQGTNSTSYCHIGCTDCRTGKYKYLSKSTDLSRKRQHIQPKLLETDFLWF